MDEARIRAHIAHKVAMRELDPDVAGRMIGHLDAGDPPDYAALLTKATFLPLPALVHHTAPASARDSIARDGLRAAAPVDGPRWGSLATGQPRGVYVAEHPDERGVWADEETWDVWAVDTTGLPWTHDRLNPGCWILTCDVPATAVVLVGTFGRE